ncbi:MAG TPA: hypothetical protein DHV62_02800, partial [Elusimicrobia bacterium]|nr:hypothetical protein [Elusimicrobiota bacterium]
MPRNQPPFSYFAQTYNLQMWGPLGLPSLGQTKIGLSYRLAKNELVLPLFGKSDLRGYNYTLNFWFAPRRVRDFFSSTFSFSRGTREEFLENGILASSEVNT